MKQPILQTNQTRRAFTLVEILVVLVIIGLLMGIALPIYTSMLPRLRMLAAAHELVLDLRRAHNHATASRKPIDIIFDPAHNAYTLDNKPTNFSVALSVILKTSTEQPDTPTIRFYPDGSATPAQIGLSDGKSHTFITIDGLTGQALANAQ